MSLSLHLVAEDTRFNPTKMLSKELFLQTYEIFEDKFRSHADGDQVNNKKTSITSYLKMMSEAKAKAGPGGHFEVRTLHGGRYEVLTRHIFFDGERFRTVSTSISLLPKCRALKCLSEEARLDCTNSILLSKNV